MGLETGNYINDLVVTNPTATDPKSVGDDHFRLIKSVIKQCLNGFAGAILVTGTDTGSANTYAIAPTTTLAGYSTNTFFLVKILNANTGACTLNVSSLGAKNIKTIAGADPSAGDVSGYCLFVYDGTNMVLLSGSAFLSKTGNQTFTGNLTLTGNQTVSGTLGVTGAVSTGALTVTGGGSFTSSVTGVTEAQSDNSTKYATTAYVTQKAFAAALPAQALGFLGSDGTNASFTKTFTGFAVNTVRATVASHATTADIWSAAGNEIDFTGTETITDFPDAPVAGASRILHCAGACTFTNNANISVEGAANYTAAAGDIVTVHAITTSTFRVTIKKADGTAVTAPTVASQSTMETATNNTNMVTPLAVNWHPGVAKAWVKADASGNVLASHNITSVTDTATGRITVTIATDFSSANYAVVASVSQAGAVIRWPYLLNSAIAAGSFEIQNRDTAGAAADPDAWYAACFGDQ
jgi:hypothetical protein